MNDRQPPRRQKRFPTIAAGVALAAGLAAAPVRTPSAVGDDLDDVEQQIHAVLDNQSLADPAKRAAVTPKVVPLLQRQSALLGEMADVRHLPPQRAVPQRSGCEATLYLLGDKPTVDRIDTTAAGAGDDAGRARFVQLWARWKAAGSDQAQAAVVNDVEKVDAAHPGDAVLSIETFNLGAEGASPESQERLVTIATETMKNPAATSLATAAKQIKMERRAAEESAAKQQALVGQAMVIAGPTVDGTPFTTADWRGRVVLVDFWATWCVPCRAEMPQILEAYRRHHAQGLEVLGVSGDLNADPLKRYVAQTALPWPQLFDAKAAAARDPNPVAAGYGIVTLPTMYAIDRHGVCRSITAYRELDDLLPKLLAEK